MASLAERDMVWIELMKRLGPELIAKLTGVAQNDGTKVASHRVPAERWRPLADAIAAQGDPRFAETVAALGGP